MKGVTQMDFDSAITKSFRMPKFPGTNMFKPPTIKPIRFGERMGKGFRMPTMPKPPTPPPTTYPFLKTNDMLKTVNKMRKL